MTEHEHLLQRLTDGELQAPARLALMREAEAQPALWREIALSFIESQRLEEELGELFTEESHESPSPVVRLSHRRSSWSWAMAASLVAMLTLGFLLGSQVSELTQEAIPSATPVEPLPVPEASTDAPYRLLVEASSSEGPPQLIDLPAYDERTLHHRIPRPSKDGWEVGWRTNILTGELQDGRRVVVPVSMPSVHYQGQ